MKLQKISLFILSTLLPILGSTQIFDSDVIVKGSICAGLECINTELFGNDTQRFKEDNLRIHFDDASILSNFPANDWRILINDTQDNGDNYFAIEDATANEVPFRVDAGAGANAFYINEAGNVGIGTDNVSENLQLTRGNTPTLRLDQDATGGFAEQVWDVAGNETNFFIRDVTNGDRLPFKIIPGAPDDALYINSNGNVTIGDDVNLERLYVKGNTALDGDVIYRRKLNRRLKLAYLDGSNQFAIQRVDNNDNNNTTDLVKVHRSAPENSLIVHQSGAMSIGSDTENRKLYINGGLTVNGDIQALSDRRLKTDIKELPYGLDAIMSLAPKQYNFVNKGYEDLTLPEDSQLGLIAQEVQKVIPELVTENINAKDAKGESKKLMGVNYTALIPVLVKAIQEQEQQHTEEIASLHAKIDDLSSKLNMVMAQPGSSTNQSVSTSPAINSDEYNLMHSEASNNNATDRSDERKEEKSRVMNDGRTEEAIKNHKY